MTGKFVKVSPKRVKEDHEEMESSPATKPKKRKTPNDIAKPPTAQEISHLRETENLFHSSLFRLQIDEMLQELRIKKKRENNFTIWFSSVKDSITKMKTGKKRNLMNQEWLRKHGVSMPIFQNPFDVEGDFQFIPPVSISVIGSYAVGCSFGPHLNVDIAIEMPSESFHSRDLINQRYIRKRALYLCCVVSHLVSTKSISSEEAFAPRFKLIRAGNPMIPVAEVVPTGSLEGHATIYLHITAAEESFKLTRLGPTKNAIREGWYFNSDIAMQEKGLATPVHNASMLGDLAVRKNEELKTQMLGDSQALKDGILLLKVWMRQRELDKGLFAFGNYLMSMVVVYLVHCRKLSPHMSSYQVARTVWNFLKNQDWTAHNGGITLCEKPIPGAPTLDEFHDNYDVVFVDSTGYCNLAAHVDATSFHRVKKESACAIQCLDDSSLNSFQALFMTPAPFIRYFDHVLCFHNMAELCKMFPRMASKKQIIDLSQHPLQLAAMLLISTLKKGLGDRILEWGINVPSILSWDVKEKPPSACQSIMLGINLDPANAFSILTKGPPANFPEADEFRIFWGKKSELRRFKDGNIAETVVWLPEKDITFANRRLVCRLITEYLLEHKFGLDPQACLLYIADQIEPLLHLPNCKPATFAYGTGEEATLSVLSVLDKLSSDLRAIPELPLAIVSIQGTSSVCRYANVSPPLSMTHRARRQFGVARGSCFAFDTDVPLTRLPPLISPVEVVLQLSLSGKWPDDAQAVRRVRAAFNIQIAEFLKSRGLCAQAYASHVDVLREGLVFRLRVAYGREPSLLRQHTLPDGTITSIASKEAEAVEKSTVLIPRITGYLHGLHQQCPGFGPTACLAKRWIAAHMFRFSHIPDIVVELLVARLFLRPEPYPVPCQPQTAFLRFLHMLSSTNWHIEPIILNFNSELSRDDLTDIEKRFTSQRTELPSLFIATPTDYERSTLSKEAPNLTILFRLALLASESLKIFHRLYLNPSSLNSSVWKQVFRPSLESFNVLIHLDTYMNPRRAWRVDAVHKSKEPYQLEPYKKTPDEKLPIIDFDPVECYLRELEENYGELALFFHDMFGGNVIGVVWKPTAIEPREFKVSQVNGRRLEGTNLVLNIDAILEDLYILGQGLVKSIENRSGCSKDTSNGIS